MEVNIVDTGRRIHPRGGGAADNPFASEHVRPGMVDFDDDSRNEDVVQSLFDDFERARFRGQILGRHGAGKTTLLVHLAHEAVRRGHPVELWHRRTRERLTPDDGPPKRVIYAIDSFDRRWPWTQLRTRSGRRLTRGGLLVTTHRRIGLPTLHTRNVTPKQAIRIARQLLGDRVMELPSESAMAAMLETAHGNFRIVLRQLYDGWERQTRARASREKPLAPIQSR